MKRSPIMSRFIAFVLAAAAIAAHGAESHSGADQPALVLAENGASEFRIAIAQSASPSERRAAIELQQFLEQICDARLPIVTDEEALGEHEIILGDNAHLRSLGIELNIEDLGSEGFVIRTAPPHLIIAGGKQRGTIYGVYAFLEEYLGCRWFTSTVSRIPHMARIELNVIDDRQKPALEYREVFFFDALDADWSARNRLNSSMGRLTDDQGGKVTYYPFVHTFWTLIPPDNYFESHPEWFSLVDGKRTLVGRFKRTQLCLTNEDMTQQAIATVKEWIRDHPEANIISISQNDGPGGWCECETCAALEASEGGAHSAPIIHFVNRIAEAIGVEHPDLAIDTLAYTYSRPAPKTLKPLPNVIIRLTSGGCCSHAIADEECDQNAALRNDIRDWFRLTQRMYIWDYTVNFHQYLLPFPNLHTLGPNIRFLVDHGVRGIFEQGSGDVPHSDMAPLKAYLLAKMLWNPDVDRQLATKEFLEMYYGPAGASIDAYLRLLERETKEGAYRWFHMSPFERNTFPTYLTAQVLANATRLFDEAEHLVADDAERLLRVQVARLSLDYVKLLLVSRLDALAGAEKKEVSMEDWRRRANDQFFATAQRAGIGHMRESGRPESTMEAFRQYLESCADLAEGNRDEGE